MSASKCIIFIFFLNLIWSTIILSERSFKIDFEKNEFVKDGNAFRYASGSLHYFRVPSVLWRDRMIKYKAAGLNAIQTYVEWSFHEPERGNYEFDGDRDLIQYLQTAQELDLVVILRLGPFIDAERDMGGFPYWLLTINPKMQLRTSDPTYLAEVDRWYSVLLPKLVPMLYNNGGPVITLQVENEYGSYDCDFAYTAHLRDLFHSYLGHDVVLFTTDGNGDPYLKCGKIDNVLSTVDFGVDGNVTASFAVQHLHQEFGPSVNSEFYPGWLDHWEEPHSTTATKDICDTLDQMLSVGANVNVYMFHGGTSFGFGAGSNIDTTFEPCPTSYDYDAPLNEAGDPTDKYYAMRKIIGKYLPLPNTSIPVPSPKMQTKPIVMTPMSSIFESYYLAEPIYSEYPLTFEQLRQRNGFILYSTNISVHPSDPAILDVSGLADRAQVFVDMEYVGTLSRTQKIFQLPVNVEYGSRLDIFVENQGRVCFGSQIGELKGITSNVTLGPVILKNWNHYKFFSDWTQEINSVQKQHLLNEYSETPLILPKTKGIPSLYVGSFTIPNERGYPLDTFLRLDGWRKGLAFINGFNLGRYWPVAGPQLTLYTPSHLFNPYPQQNYLVLFELESSPCISQDSSCTVQFVKTHVVNGTTPYSSDLFAVNDYL